MGEDDEEGGYSAETLVVIVSFVCLRNWGITHINPFDALSGVAFYG